MAYRVNTSNRGVAMNDINSYGIAMAMYHTKRIVEPCEQSKDKQERERKEQAFEKKLLINKKKIDIVV